MNLSVINSSMLGVWALFGVVASLIIHFSNHNQVKGGLIVTIILGVIGALLGGIMAVIVVGIKYSNFRIAVFLLAILGGLLLSLFSHLIFRQKQYIKTVTSFKRHTY